MSKPYGSPLVDCPSCSKKIGTEHPYTWCSECGNPLPRVVLKMLNHSIKEENPSSTATVASEVPKSFIENQIRNSIIPATRTFGVITGIIIAAGLIFSGSLLTGLAVGTAYISSAIALSILLEGFAEIITLLRRISDRLNSPHKLAPTGRLDREEEASGLR